MAAAYAQGIIKNHPFIDGNKRTGIVTSLLFMAHNDYNIEMTQDKLYKLGIAIATSKITSAKVATYLRKHSIYH